ncbi:MAG: aminopeptidase P family protein [Rhodospirillaceae bacterium]|nr:aminopeptidase P family protein [Rhodospirillaceae bacterium]
MLFPKEEYTERLGRLRAIMAERDVEMVIADEAEMLHYFTGFAISENIYRAVVIPMQGTPTMIVRRLDEQPFLNVGWFDNRRAFHDLEDPVAIIADVIKSGGAKRIGLDMNSYCMPAKRFNHLTGLLPGITFIDFSDAFRPLRLNKSPREIEVMRKAAAIADTTMLRAVAAAVPGASSRTAAAVASSSFIELGADFGRTGPITVGRGWNFLHGKLSDDPLQLGDVLHLELVPKVSGYCARLMRPAVMGAPSAELSEAAAGLIEIQDRQIAAMVPGAVASEVDAIMREGAVDAGLRDDYVNNTGYTLGYYFEQAPRTSDFTRLFTPEAGWRLEAGMTFHMYTSAVAGIAFSETVLVTEDGPECLTKIERKLFQCGEVS